MPSDLPHSGSKANGLPSLEGSRVTLLSLTDDGEVLTGCNVPDGIPLATFGKALVACRLSGISGRTLGDVIRIIGKDGGLSREQCTITGDGFLAHYDAELWRQDDGAVGVLLVDVTGKDQDSSDVRSLSLELAHRTKNVLAIVLSLANQTARRMPGYEQFKERFFGQVGALSNAHDIIAETGWRGASVRRIADTCVNSGA